MIIGVGIDAVEISRFKQWHTYTEKKLTRFFSPEEIAYCLSLPTKAAERFAARFAAKEAFLKAVSSLMVDQHISLLKVARALKILHNDQQKPELIVDWDYFLDADQKNINALQTHVSLTHCKTLALATVIIEKL